MGNSWSSGDRIGATTVTDIIQLKSALTRAITVLRAGGNENWARSLESIESELEADPSEAKSRILSMFGGMGSFNDLVLYRDGKVLFRENEELSRLRTEIYNLCRS